MATAIGWLLTLGPLVFALLKKVIPKLLPKIQALLGGLLGSGAGSAVTRGGILGAVGLFLSRIWGWLQRFPAWLKTLFAVGGTLHFVRNILIFLLNFAKTPILLGIALVTSSIFPTFVEKIFLVVGAVVLHIFLFVFKLGKNVFLGALNEAGASGTGGVLDEFRDSVMGSFDALPPCMVDIMGYLHLVEDLGLIITTATLLALVSVFRIVYGGFLTDKLK